MLISMLLIAAAAAGGFAITYLIDDDAPILWRLAAGNIIGSAVFGTLGFLLTLVFGLNAAVVIVALVVTTSALLIFYADNKRKKLLRNWYDAKSRLQGAPGRRFFRLAYYTFFFLLFFFFFDRSMIVSPDGIFTGGSQNLGDLPFHLGAIFSFTEANNLPPVNPSFSGARFSYPFIADLLTAFAVKLGAGLRDAMFVQNVSWAISLVIVLERFVFKLTESRLAARLAPPLLFFSGGLGFVWFIGDYWSQAKGFFDFLTHLPKDYTIGDGFRWGNSMVVLFMTQRSLLLGMPLTLIVLGYLWREFALDRNTATDHTEKVANRSTPSGPPHVSPSPRFPFSMSAFIVGLLAGLLPLIHLHSLAVLFVVGLFLFILKPEKWVTWISFAAGVAVIAVPELIWSMAGSASETSKFFGWHFGWDKGEQNFLSFWFTNTGIFIPILLAGIYFIGIHQKANTRSTASGQDAAEDRPQSRKAAKKRQAKGSRRRQDDANSALTTQHSALLFYLPFAFLFLVANIAKLAPWEWDNIKVLIYWFVGSIPFAALAIAWMWNREIGVWKFCASVCFVVLIASGALDVWRVVSGQINYKVFDSDAVEIAEQIERRVPANSLFLNAPTYNTAIVLTGRQSLMRYPGHLGSHGIDYSMRESDVKRIYQGGSDAIALMEKYGIDHVLISPEERNMGGVNEQFFARFPIAAESGQYRLYRIR